MSTSVSYLQKGLIAAFSRLQVWFDPAQTGSPYEKNLPHHGGKTKRFYPLFTKKLSIRI